MCNQLRKMYFWPPQVFDTMEVHKLIFIYNQALEDSQKEKKDEVF